MVDIPDTLLIYQCGELRRDLPVVISERWHPDHAGVDVSVESPYCRERSHQPTSPVDKEERRASDGTSGPEHRPKKDPRVLAVDSGQSQAVLNGGFSGHCRPSGRAVIIFGDFRSICLRSIDIDININHNGRKGAIADVLKLLAGRWEGEVVIAGRRSKSVAACLRPSSPPPQSDCRGIVGLLDLLQYLAELTEHRRPLGMHCEVHGTMLKRRLGRRAEGKYSPASHTFFNLRQHALRPIPPPEQFRHYWNGDFVQGQVRLHGSGRVLLMTAFIRSRSDDQSPIASVCPAIDRSSGLHPDGTGQGHRNLSTFSPSFPFPFPLPCLTGDDQVSFTDRTADPVRGLAGNHLSPRATTTASCYILGLLPLLDGRRLSCSNRSPFHRG